MGQYDQLLALLNRDNPSDTPFTADNVTFSNLSVNTTNNRNTKITVNEVPGAGFIGTIDVYYNRIDFQELDSNVWLFSDVPFTSDITINLLNTFRNCVFLQASDVQPLVIPGMRVGDIVVMGLVANATSINWIGQTQLSLFMGFPVIADFLNQLVNINFAAPGYLN